MTRRWRRRSDVLWRRTLDSVVLLSVGASEPVVLAGTGPSVWDLLTDPIDADGLVGLLAEQYAAAVDQVAQDVEWLLGHLESCGVIESYGVDS